MNTKNNSQPISSTSGDVTVNQKLIRRRNELWLAACLTAFMCMAAAKAQLSSSTSGGGETGGFPGGCNCLCPPNPPAGGCPYCDNGGGTSRCAESIGWTTGYGYGYVLDMACADFGVLRGRVLAQPTNEVFGMSFSSSAYFHDAFTPTLPGFVGITQAIVRVAFHTRGERNGFTQGSANLRLSSSLDGAVVNFASIPDNDTQILSARIQIGGGNIFQIEAGFQLSAGNCGTPLVGGEIDYYSGSDYGIRITQIGFFDTNGVPLPGVHLYADYGANYRIGPIISFASLTNGSKEIQVVGFPGSNYVTEASASLNGLSNSWTPISTNTADAQGIIRIDLADDGSLKERFFRARTL